MSERFNTTDLNGEDYVDIEVTPYGAFIELEEGGILTRIQVTLSQLQDMHTWMSHILQDLNLEEGFNG